MHIRNQSFVENPVTVEQFGSLIDSIDKGIISANAGKQILSLMVEGDKRLADPIIEEKGLQQLLNTDELASICAGIVAKNPEQLKQLRKGNENVRNWFLGQVMRQTKNKANPQLANQMMKKCLDDALAKATNEN